MIQKRTVAGVPNEGIKSENANGCRHVHGERNSPGFLGRVEGMSRDLNMEEHTIGL